MINVLNVFDIKMLLGFKKSFVKLPWILSAVQPFLNVWFISFLITQAISKDTLRTQGCTINGKSIQSDFAIFLITLMRRLKLVEMEYVNSLSYWFKCIFQVLGFD